MKDVLEALEAIEAIHDESKEFKNRNSSLVFLFIITLLINLHFVSKCWKKATRLIYIDIRVWK